MEPAFLKHDELTNLKVYVDELSFDFGHYS